MTWPMMLVLAFMALCLAGQLVAWLAWAPVTVPSVVYACVLAAGVTVGIVLWRRGE